jgi:hypothetical protein
LRQKIEENGEDFSLRGGKNSFENETGSQERVEY